MSLTSSSPRPRGRLGERLDPLVMWAGHYVMFFTAAWIAAGLANIATGWKIGVLGDISDGVTFVWFVAFGCDILRHEHGLCERCITQSPTLNPEAALRRWKWSLWWFHHKVLRLMMPVLLLVWIFGGDIAGITRPSPNFDEQPWQLAIDGLLLIGVGVTWLIIAQHRRLYPWCPWCHWGGDGDGDHEPSPAPQHPATAS